MAVLAHPDDESLGFGGTLARCSSDGVETFLVTATRGERGRYRGHAPGDAQHPGPVELGRIRERELRAAAASLGVREVSLLDYRDGDLDRANPREAVERIAAHIRRVRPHVVITFGAEGAYGLRAGGGGVLGAGDGRAHTPHTSTTTRAAACPSSRAQKRSANAA